MQNQIALLKTITSFPLPGPEQSTFEARLSPAHVGSQLKNLGWPKKFLCWASLNFVGGVSVEESSWFYLLVVVICHEFPLGILDNVVACSGGFASSKKERKRDAR